MTLCGTPLVNRTASRSGVASSLAASAFDDLNLFTAPIAIFLNLVENSANLRQLFSKDIGAASWSIWSQKAYMNFLASFAVGLCTSSRSPREPVKLFITSAPSRALRHWHDHLASLCQISVKNKALLHPQRLD